MKKQIENIINYIGFSRIIIFLFLVLLIILNPFVGLKVDIAINDWIVRFGMNAILVLSLVPMAKTGCGLNFGLQLGIIAGILGAIITVEMEMTGFKGFFTAMGIAILFAVVIGFLYGLLLNRIKGNEMVVATYVGFSSVAIMCIMWLILPFKSPNMIWAYGGGLRPTISVESYYYRILTNLFKINIGNNLFIPTGTILFFVLITLLVWAFFKTKIGSAMVVSGHINFAKSCGISVDKMRIISVILSTVIAAIGILVYQEGFGFIQIYDAPLFMPFPAIAALLLGGAAVGKASIKNVVIGTILFQGVLTITPPIMNNIIQSDMSEALRMIISNGMIVYALTRVAIARER